MKYLKANSSTAKPFLKWAGGKKQLLNQYQQYFPDNFKNYFEPFLGSAAVYFYLKSNLKINSDSYLSDNNQELIDTYLVVRDNLIELINLLKEHESLHSKSYYYKIRSLDRLENAKLSKVERAARMIYLNRTCYNGLYRVNSKNQFNVPIGSYKNPKILFEDVLVAASNSLKKAKIIAKDFGYLIKKAKKGDFIYFDPPYHPLSKTSNFTSYTSGNFNEEDQIKLAELFIKLSGKGAMCMLSNSYTPLILDLYKDFAITKIKANRAINSKGSNRGSIKEVLILNY